MSLRRRLRYFYLAHFSQPKEERGLLRLVYQRKIRRILELGVGNGRRAESLIEVAQFHDGEEPIRYFGVDLFEARPEKLPGGLSLKEAHKRINATGAKAQFIPGDPYSALARSANAIRDVELLIISADQDDASLARAWFYVPRMLAAGATVLRYVVAGEAMRFEPIAAAELQRRASAPRERVAA